MTVANISFEYSPDNRHRRTFHSTFKEANPAISRQSQSHVQDGD